MYLPFKEETDSLDIRMNTWVSRLMIM